MSSPPSESGHHAAPTGSVRPEQEQACKKTQSSSQSKDSKWIPSPSHTSRKNPSSLLTQAFVSSRETEQSPSSAGTCTSPQSNSPLSSQNTQRNNEPNTDPEQLPASKMATVASATMTDLRTGMHVGPSPTSADFNLRDIESSNSAAMNHRQLFSSNARGRGTSLERTEKERRVQGVPKGSYSTNPGDTGILGAAAPIPPTSSESISRTPPTEGVRAQYRSWRDAHRYAMAGKAWSISNQGSEDSQDGQVEKSVKKVLAGVEHNNRSRKASHSLGFFKEGLP